MTTRRIGGLRLITGEELRKFATPGDVHVDALMTDFAINYGNAGFVGEALFPYANVRKKSDKYAVFNKKRTQERVPNTLRAPRTAAKAVDWDVDLTNSYSAEERALAAGVDDGERDNADAPIDPDQRATRAALIGILLDFENDVATKATTAANYPTGHSVTLAGVNQWSDLTNSDPKKDVDDGREKILDDAGVLPNTIVIPWKVVQTLKRNSKILDAFKYVQGGVITVDMLSNYFEIDRVVIAAASKNTAAEGQTAVLAKLWGKDVILAFVDPNPSPLDGISFGKAFRWIQNGQARLTRRFREERARTDWYEVSQAHDIKITAGEAAYIIKAAIA